MTAIEEKRGSGEWGGYMGGGELRNEEGRKEVSKQIP